MTALAADPPSAWHLLKIAEIAETVPGGVPEEFADIAAGGVAERLASASDGTARTLLLAPGLPERVRAVALERLLQGFPRAAARLLRGVLLGPDTPPGLRGLAAGAVVGRPVGPLLALVADGRLDRGVWLPAALREPAAGAALAWEDVRAGRGTPAERSAVVACLCASGAAPPSGTLDRLLADLPRWDAARPWLAAELTRRDRDAGIAALRAMILAREAPPALRRSAAERLHGLDGEAALAAFVQAAEDDPVPSPGVRAMAPLFEPGGSLGDAVLRRLAEHAVPGAAAPLLGRDAAAELLDRPDVWTRLSRDRRVMKRVVRFLRFLAGWASRVVAAARRGAASLSGRVPEALRFRRRRFGRTPSPAVEAAGLPELPARPADLLAACERLLEAIDEEDEAAFRALDEAVRRARDDRRR
jgi:hypothetical protein